MLRVGLTGGIACGKTHVLRGLAAAGVPVLDLDAVAHEVMAPGGPAYDDVVAAFGSAVLGPDGGIDRKTLGALVFADPRARARLNALVHPRVRAEEARRAAALPEVSLLVTDAALLVEAGVHLRFDRLVVVHCNPEAQRLRLMQRDRIGEAAARARIESQMPVAEKLRFAHFEVNTSGSREQTAASALRLAGELRELAARRPQRVAVPLERALGILVHGPRRGPRGLDPPRLLEEAAASGGIELERLGRLLVPPAQGPWYRCARADEGDPGPEALAGPLVLIALSRRGPDPEYLAAAAASLARVTHADRERIGAACLAALAVLELAVTGRAPDDPATRFGALAQRWSGGRAKPEAVAAFRASLAAMAVPAAVGDGEPRLVDLLGRL